MERACSRTRRTRLVRLRHLGWWWEGDFRVTGLIAIGIVIRRQWIYSVRKAGHISSVAHDKVRRRP